MRTVVVALILLVACKRTDPHARERGVAPADDVQPTAGTVPAGSLLAPSIEVWLGVMLPAPSSPEHRAALEAEARAAGFVVGGDPAARWLVVKDSTPAGAGYTASSDAVLLHIPDADRPQVQAVTGAIVIGAGGPSGDLEAIHNALVALARRAALEGHGWILDEQTDILFDVAGFDAGPARSARDAASLIAFTSVTDSTGDQAVETMGMSRFGLPELRVRGGRAGMMGALQDPLRATAQVLLDHGGLTRDGVLEINRLPWTVDWAEVTEGQPRVLALTPPGGPDQLDAALTSYYGAN